MPGSIPGPLGFAAFSGVKFGGYAFAAQILKRVYDSDARVLPVAITRTLVGLGVGVCHLILWAVLLSKFKYFKDDFSGVLFIVGLLLLRLIIWTMVIKIFFDPAWKYRTRTILYAVACTAFSFILDGLGIALAFVTPGQISFC